MKSHKLTGEYGIRRKCSVRERCIRTYININVFAGNSTWETRGLQINRVIIMGLIAHLALFTYFFDCLQTP